MKNGDIYCVFTVGGTTNRDMHEWRPVGGSNMPFTRLTCGSGAAEEDDVDGGWSPLANRRGGEEETQDEEEEV